MTLQGDQSGDSSEDVREEREGFVRRTASAYVVAVLADRVAAFTLTGMLAWAFGAGSRADAFYVAYWLPVMVITLASDAVFAAVLPRLQHLRTLGIRDRVVAVAASLLKKGCIAAVGVTGLYFMAAPVVVLALAHGTKPGVRTLALQMASAYGPYVCLSILTSITGAVVASLHGHLRNAALVPVGTALIALATAGLLLSGAGPMSFPIGASIGQALAFGVVLLPKIRVVLGEARTARGRSEVGDMYAGVLPLGALALPGLVFLVVVGAERALATDMEVGTAAVLAFARALLILPGLLAAPLGNAVMARLPFVHPSDRGSEIWSALGWSLFYCLAVSVALATDPEFVVRLTFGRGAFNERDVDRTANTLLLMLPGFAGFCLYPVLTRVLQAERRVRELTVSSLAMTSYIAFAPSLGSHLGERGLAIALSGASSAAAIVAIWLVASRTGCPEPRVVRGWWCQIGVAGGVVCVVRVLGPAIGPSQTWGPVLLMSMAATAFFGGCLLLGVPEARHIVHSIVRRDSREEPKVKP